MLIFLNVYITLPVFSSETFLKEASQNWTMLKTKYKQGYSSDSICQYGNPGAKEDEIDLQKITTILHEHCLLDKCELFKSIRKNRKILECVNDNYGFVLKKDEDDKEWTISTFVNNPKVIKNEQIGIIQGTMDIFEGIMIEGAWIESLVFSREFKILSIEEDILDQQTFKKIVFQSQFDVDEHNRILSGALWFDSEHFWILKQYKIELQSDTLGSAIKKFQYRFLDNVPFPEKIVLDYKFEKDSPIRYVTTYNSTSNQCDPVIFRLSHYDFPEPSRPTQYGNVIRIILIIVSIMLIITGLYFRYRVYKK
jgi:hypothetical protein